MKRKKYKVKRDDEVVVLSGTEKGKRGKVLAVFRDQERVIVEGVKMIKKHLKKGRNPNAPQGAIIEREGTLHISNVMLAKRYDERRARKGLAAAPETE